VDQPVSSFRSDVLSISLATRIIDALLERRVLLADEGENVTMFMILGISEGKN
jgi:hypothetical protein